MKEKRSYKLNKAPLALAILLVGVLLVLSLSASINADENTSTGEISVDAIQFGDLRNASVCKPSVRLARFSAARTSGNGLYETIVDGLESSAEKIYITDFNATIEDVRGAYTQALNSNPALFYVSNSFSYSKSGDYVVYVAPQYTYTGDTLKSMRANYENLVSEILSKVSSSWSDLEKVLFIHDYLVKNFEYDTTSEHIYDAYGFLTQKRGVCQAYTLLAVELYSRLGIGVGTVVSEPMLHIWNCVQLDGKWYHLDITWGDALSSSTNADRFDKVSYASFLCGDSAITASEHRDWEASVTFSDDYDDLFVKGIPNVCVSYCGDDFYVLLPDKNNSQNGVTIALADFDGNTYAAKNFLAAQWKTWDNPNSTYVLACAGMDTYCGVLVITTADALYAYLPDTNSFNKIGDYTYDSGYIYGLKMRGTNATLRIAKSPEFSLSDTYADIDLSKIEFELKITYVNDLTETLYNAYIASVGWGNKYSVDLPTINGYSTPLSKNEGVMMFGGVSLENKYLPDECKITINCVYENGELIKTEQVIVGYGRNYQIPVPEIGGYNSETAILSGTADSREIELAVKYTPKKYSLEIVYVYADGSEAGETYFDDTLEYLDEYSIPTPKIENFTPSVELVSGIADETENIKVRVEYSINKYKIEFYNGDTIYFEVQVEHGSEIPLPSSDPTKPSDAENHYTFTGWSGYIEGETAIKDISYRAVFEPSRRTYSVKFLNYDGSLLYETEVYYNEIPQYEGEEPTRVSDGSVTYTFVGWDIDIEEITEDTVYTALFSDGVTVLKVYFYDEDGKTLLSTQEVYYGYSAIPPEAPVKNADLVYTYTFDSWSGKYKKVTSDSIVKATYKAEYIDYTITFEDHDRSVIEKLVLHYGDTVTLPDDPIREDDSRYRYIFTSWTPGVSLKVMGNATYTAVYLSEYKFKFTSEDFISAVNDITEAQTLAERFAAIINASEIKDNIYLEDEELSEALEIYENEIEKYNSEVSSINEHFIKASEKSAEINSFESHAFTMFALAFPVVKRFFGIL